jgi:hypothetical protein
MPARSRLWPDPRVKPPYGAAEIDWSHPLGAPLVAAFVLNEGGGGPREMVRGLGAAPQNTTAWTTTRMGLARSYTGTTSCDAYLGLEAIGGGSALTLVAFVSNVISGGVVASKADANAGLYDWMMMRSGGNDQLRFLYGSGLAVDSGITATGKDFYAITASASGQNWQSGDLTATTGGVTLVANNKRLVLGGRYLNPTYDLGIEGVLNAFFWFRVAFSFGQLAWLRAEPYTIFRPIVRRRYFVPAATTSIPVKMHHYTLMRS